MSKGKGRRDFTRDIADILADDLELLEAIEPDAMVRPAAPGDATEATAPDATALVVDQPALPLEAPTALPQPTPVEEAARPAPAITEAEAPVVEEMVVAREPHVSDAAPLALVPEPAVEARPPAAEAVADAAPSPVDEPVAPAADTASPVAAAPVEAERPPDAAPVPAAAGPATGAVAPGASPPPAAVRHFGDAVTLLEIAPPEEGGIRESAIAVDRAESPPAPRKARRLYWTNPYLAWPLYMLGIVALTLFFVYLFAAVLKA